MNGARHRKEEIMNFEKIKEVIVDTLSCNPEDVTMEASLEDTLGMDSLDAVQVNMAIEEALGVQIPDEELANMKTVGDIVEYVDAHEN